MLKKTILISSIISLLTVSCSTSDDGSSSELSLSEQIEKLVQQPYSKLTPSEQKVKLEAEANAMLTDMDKSKTSSAIEAMQNLGNLLDISSIDIFNGKNDNKIEDIINVSGVYGVYTWNNTTQKWTKTSSSSELKFIFPAKKGGTSNNATLTSNSTSSNIKVNIIDTYGNWNYNTNSYSNDIKDQVFLPLSVNSTLSIDNKEVAKIESTAKYDNKEVPTETSLKINLNDGYAYEMSSAKGSTNSAKLGFSYNGKSLISFTAGSTAQIDKILDDSSVASYHGKANAIIQIMDNFIILEDINIEGTTNAQNALDKSVVYPNYNSNTYHNDLNKYYKAQAEGEVAITNNNTKSILVSKKDGTKIADLVQRAEKGDSYYEYYTKWNSTYRYWEYNASNPILIQHYDTVTYLRFNDNTEVEISAYFSSGFDDLNTRFENFWKSFERK
ncbi:hypothetical protein [Flavobacterium sp. UMI-01]|uniref:hypothetical protein n=1 Tax=Flavobacterium sp. UMI-01 TaxID=1441053 RepID=UPI001C7D1399|nr:hypothetical protein [Flavobacterium sp. UMI-01]GIZ10357.1 hypothetical protein FUMI01_30810 [Flavobacterium sp. UMI-01]